MNHPWLGMVNIPPIKLVFWGMVYYCFTHMIVISWYSIIDRLNGIYNSINPFWYATMVNMDLWIPNGLWIHHQATWEDSSANWMTVNDTLNGWKQTFNTVIDDRFGKWTCDFLLNLCPQLIVWSLKLIKGQQLAVPLPTWVSGLLLVQYHIIQLYIYIYNNKCYKREKRCAPRIAGAMGIHYKVPSGSQTEWRFWFDWENHRTRWWLSSGPPSLMTPEVVFFPLVNIQKMNRMESLG